MKQEQKIARDIATHLVFLGLKKGECVFYENEYGERHCRVAKWKISKSQSVDVYCYFAHYFGAERFWVGFGARDSTKIAAIMEGIPENTYEEIKYGDWGDNYTLLNSQKLERLKRRKLTSYEDYTDQRRFWAWFGLYLPLISSSVSEAVSFLRFVVKLRQSNQPVAMKVRKGPTEKRRDAKMRVGQDEFRKAVLDEWQSECAVTGCGIVPLLEAAHIREWADSKSLDLRKSASNGILMTRTMHSLFDLGCISFSNTGNMMISRFVDNEQRKYLKITDGMKIVRPLSSTQKKNMGFHRKQKFLGR